MKIVAAEVFVTSPSRNFVTLRITTEDGVTGIGDATLNGRELAVAAYLKEHVAQLLIGKDPHRIEDTWQFLYRSSYWRRGPVTMAAIAAVDMALWDIKGKVAGMPVYQLLGGASRNGLRAYGHASGSRTSRPCSTPSANILSWATSPSASRPPSRASRPSTAWPPRHRPPVSATTTSLPAAATSPWKRTGTPAPTCATCPTVFEAVRNEFGPEIPLLHDGHHRMTPIQAAKLGKALEPYDLFWLEDCTPAENQEGLRLVRQHTTTPLAIGEIFNTVWDYQTLIKEQLIDYVRAASTHFGGISPLKKVMDFAAQYQIKSGFHGPTDISPVGFAAATARGPGHPQLRHPGVHAALGQDQRGLPAVHDLQGRLSAPRRPTRHRRRVQRGSRRGASRTSRPTCPTTASWTAPFMTGENVCRTIKL